MNDAIVGARVSDSTIQREAVIVGVYECAVRDEDDRIVDTEVYVDLLYDGDEDPVAVELSLFKNDEGLEVVELPEWE